jgi:hypothetical protein
MARIPAPLRAEISTLDVGKRRPIAGIDVGECYLDLAIIEVPGAPALRFARIDLQQLSSDPIENLAHAIARTMPWLGRDAIVLVDSPRNPRGWDRRSGKPISPVPRGRAIDAALHEIVGAIRRKRGAADGVRLSMFPTPEIEYFIRCAADPRCKPHLAAFAREILHIATAAHNPRMHRGGGGWLFTRFMLSGFAAFSALERLGASAFESYPYLSFALHKTCDERLPPKSARRDARAERARILARLAREAGMAEVPPLKSLDQADAAVLALATAIGAARGALYSIQAPGEGRFLLPVGRRDRIAVGELAALGYGPDSA